MDWLLYENDARQKGYKNICGVDEAGRGPLAGPVCAAAVILPEGCIIEGVNDSKKLTEKKREALFDVIIETAISCSVAFGTVEEIERDNILAATMNTMRRAVEGLSAASILAKVTRDRLMLEYAEKYPQYGFEKHKGYGTKLHIERILEYGESPIHRPSFLKKIYEKNLH